MLASSSNTLPTRLAAASIFGSTDGAVLCNYRSAASCSGVHNYTTMNQSTSSPTQCICSMGCHSSACHAKQHSIACSCSRQGSGQIIMLCNTTTAKAEPQVSCLQGRADGLPQTLCHTPAELPAVKQTPCQTGPVCESHAAHHREQEPPMHGRHKLPH